MEKKKIKQELEEISPFLAQLKEEKNIDPVDDVPPRYFKELPDELWNRIQAEEQKAPTVQLNQWWKQIVQQIDFLLKPQLAIGLATLALILAAIQLFRPATDVPLTADMGGINALDNLPNEALYDYVLENIGEYQTADFAEFETPIPLNNFLPLEEGEGEALDAIIDEYLERIDDFEDLL